LAGMPIEETSGIKYHEDACALSACFYAVINYQMPPPSPIVDAVVPGSGTTAGGTPVNIYGQNFQAGATVYFDTSPATNVVLINQSWIQCKTPAHSAGSVTVKVRNPDGQEGTLTNGYLYQ